MDILFLTVAIGGGHLKACQAVKEAVEQKYPGARTMIVDALKYANPVIDKLVIEGYLKAVRKRPAIYGKIYELTETDSNIFDLSSAINKLMSFRINGLIKSFNPSAIVCTHPFALQMVSNLKKKNKVNVPAVSILTDYAVHTFWMDENIDAYVVAHEHMRQDMIEKGIPENNVHAYGIPVCNGFLIRRDKQIARRELGLCEDKLTVLLMGGSLGFGQIGKVFKALIKSNRDLQIIVVTGTNKKLKAELDAYAQNKDKKTVIFSYTDKIPVLMDACDLIITKPGGMTITEALAKELPILVISPIPGHEEKNASFLVDSGAAIRVYENDNIEKLISQIVDDTLTFSQMKQKAGYLSKPDSAQKIVALLERLVVKLQGVC